MEGRLWAADRASLQRELEVGGECGSEYDPSRQVTHFQGICIGAGNDGPKALTAQQAGCIWDAGG